MLLVLLRVYFHCVKLFVYGEIRFGTFVLNFGYIRVIIQRVVVLFSLF